MMPWGWKKSQKDGSGTRMFSTSTGKNLVAKLSYLKS